MEGFLVIFFTPQKRRYHRPPKGQRKSAAWVKNHISTNSRLR